MEMKADQANESRWLYRSHCDGTLSLAENNVRVSCEVRCDRDGAIGISFDRIAVDSQSAWLAHAVREEGEVLTRFNLDAISAAGDTLSSNSVYFTDIGNRLTDRGTELDLHGSAASMTLSFKHDGATARNEETVVQYITTGMQGFGRLIRDTPLGKIAVAGAYDINDFDDLRGNVTIGTKTKLSDVNVWLNACDDLADRVLTVFSFGLGRWIGWSVRQLSLGGVVTTAQFRGALPSGSPMEPPFHFLNLDPLLDLALGFSKKLDEETGIGSAIEWLQMPSRYGASRFINAATAFERLVARTSERGGALPDEVFRVLNNTLHKCLAKPEVAHAVDQTLAHEEEQDHARRQRRVQEVLALVSTRLDQMNQRSFRTRAEQVVMRFGVDISDIQPSISQIIDIRNALIHRGSYEPKAGQPTLDRGERALREIVRRLMLAMLGYRGRYFSFWPKHEHVELKYRAADAD